MCDGQGLAALSALLGTATLAWADACPTSADTRQGIEVIYADGTTSVITRDPYGEVRETETWGGETPVTYITANGVIETGYLDPENGEQDTFSYSFATDDILPLRPWSGRSGQQVTTDASGTEINRVQFAWRTRDLGTFKISGCTFRSIPLETYYYEPSGPSMIEYAYLVDLGVPINVGSSFFSGGIGSGVPNIPVKIRALFEEE